MQKQTYRMSGGHKFYPQDDADTLLCKLQNKADDYYYNDKPCNIDKIEADIEKLELAISQHDLSTMNRMIDEYHMMFKRYH